MKSILITIVLFLTSSTGFSQEKQISFADNTNLDVTNASFKVRTQGNQKSEVSKISMFSKEFTSSLTGTGKAVPPLDDAALKILAKKNKSLAAQIKRLDSAYNLIQENSDYYFAGLNSIAAGKFSECSPEKPCHIKCRAIIVRLDDKNRTENILILRSIELVE